MAIAGQLERNDTQFAVVIGSDILDEIFLAQRLHLACPDVRFVFFNSDLLFERKVDNIPFIGDITFTPYDLIGWKGSFGDPSFWLPFADSNSVAYYNATSYILWKSAKGEERDGTLSLASYGRLFPQGPRDYLQPQLWATVVGTDGYYPLAIVDTLEKSSPCNLPPVPNGKGDLKTCDPSVDAEKTGAVSPPSTKRDTPPPTVSPKSRSSAAKADDHRMDSKATSHPAGGKTNSAVDVVRRLFSSKDHPSRLPIHPALLWFAICVVVSLLCLAHCIVLLVADFWSPFTRDLAIRENDQPHRRAMYIHIGTTMLFCMAFVVAFPLFPTYRFCEHDHYASFWSIFTLVMGCSAVIVTFGKTWPYLGWKKQPHESGSRWRTAWNGARENSYFFFNMVAWLTLVGLPALWAYICLKEYIGGVQSMVGMFFSFRCLHPESGVSPLTPILLLLFAWYCWAFFQARRLRFSEASRPVLPNGPLAGTPYPLFVADTELSECKNAQNVCLYENITCLLITRRVIQRFWPRHVAGVDLCLIGGYLALYILFVFIIPIQSLDRFLWIPGSWPTVYEFLIGSLFFPLIVIALSGWLRVIFVWGALRRGLLERLERLPIRYAFSSIHSSGWMSMLRQGSLHEQWRDIARSIESMHQIVHDTRMRSRVAEGNEEELQKMDVAFGNLDKHMSALRARREEPATGTHADRRNQNPVYLTLMTAVEKDLAHFCEGLLYGLLIPYWRSERMILVEDAGLNASLKNRHGASDTPMAGPAAPTPIAMAEEFVALRYVSLIRTVLVNMGYLMTFISLSFVLSLIAWNSYPLQPRQWIDWLFTGLLGFLGAGIVWVFAQMHRNPLLSRITNTAANELGGAFYLRIITFGAIPVLTWLAYQFPDVGSVLFRFLQPALNVTK